MESDLIERIAVALDDDDALELLGLASAMLAVFDRRLRNPFQPEPDIPAFGQFVESFLG